MKKTFTPSMIAIALLLSLNTNAQTWGSPVLVETNSVGGNTGIYTSLLIVNGNPAMTYYDITHGNLMYVRATDASGTAWTAPVAISLAMYAGDYTSMQIVNGNPAISYYDQTNSALKYVRATDASGTTWAAPVSIDVTGDVGQFTSLQIVNGMPAISYYDFTNADLKYVRASDASGTTWAAPVSIDVTGGVGKYTSLQIVNGNPAISYYDQTNGNLKYVRASDSSGTAWATPVSIDVTGDVGQFTSLQIVNGMPAISYYASYSMINTALKYVRATDSSGTAWTTPVSIDVTVTGAIGRYTSLQIVNGNPAITYYDVTNADLKYVRATNAAGTAWAIPISIDVTGNVGQYTSLQIANGNPAISYYDQTNGDLKYVRAMDASGTAWATPISFDATADVGKYTSLQIVNGNPAISYYDQTNGNLKYVRATDSSGTAWAAPVTIDATADVGQFTSLQIVNGMPAISYFYYSDFGTALKYVRAADASGTAWTAPVSIDVTGYVGQYTSLQIVNGNPAISYFDATNSALKYVRATDASGTVWATPVSIDVTGNVGIHTSLQIVNGNPAISYMEYTPNYTLKYVRAADSSGTVWATPVSIDVTGGVGEYTSLQIVNGNPAISYHNFINDDLKYVRATNASGTAWATPVSIDVTGNVGAHTSLQIVNGNPAISYFDATNSALKYVRATDTYGTAWAAPVTLNTQGDYGGQFTSMIPMGAGAGIAYYNSKEELPYFILGSFFCNNPTAPTLSASDTAICAGSSVTPSIASGTLNDAINWQWYSGSCGGTSLGSGTTITVSPIVNTTYYARGEGGCVIQGACGSVTINVDSLPTVSANATANTVCAGTSVTLTGGGASTYTWTGGISDGVSFVPASSLTYSVTGADVNSCTNTATTTINVNALPLVTTTLNGATITANQNGASYQWLDCNSGYSSIAGASNQNYMATANGDYAVMVTVNACSDTSACVNLNITGINKIEINNQLVVYPNPGKGDFTVTLSGVEGQSTSEGAYSIINESGQTIQSFKLNAANKYTMNIKTLSNGNYFIVGFNNKHMTKQKFVVTK